MIHLPVIEWDNPTQSKIQRQQTRYYISCPIVEGRLGPDDNLFHNCPDCGRFFTRSCFHDGVHHDEPVVFVDGACLDNGYPGARGGIGIAFGDQDDQQLSLKVRQCDDPDGPRTSQRAELLAAYHGLLALHNAHVEHAIKENIKEINEHASLSAIGQTWIIAMDSEYVVKGIVEWMPKWEVSLNQSIIPCRALASSILTSGYRFLFCNLIKRAEQARNWRTTSGNTPTNLDLFLKLMFFVEECEEAFDIDVKFRWIPRQENQIADSLAKEGADTARPCLWT